MTLNMISGGALLSASFFLMFLILWFYRQNRHRKSLKIEAKVPLRVDRSVLLAEQRRQVMQRKGKISKLPDSSTPGKADTRESISSCVAQPESAEDGFGEDLGAALSLVQSATTKPKKQKSRFEALQDAADQFRDIYNRNSQL